MTEITTVLDAEQARSLTDAIIEATQALANDYDSLVGMYQDAYVGRAWEALGYGSWNAYCEQAIAARVKFPREQRQQLVASFRQAGMSTRAIASAVGADQKTVRNDLAGEDNSSPAEPARPVTGMDGKTYQPTRPKVVAIRPMGQDASTSEEREGPPAPVRNLRNQRQQDRAMAVADVTAYELLRERQEAAAPAVQVTQSRRPFPDVYAYAIYQLEKAVELVARLHADDQFVEDRDALRDRYTHRVDVVEALVNSIDDDLHDRNKCQACGTRVLPLPRDLKRTLCAACREPAGVT